jgi:hypothetical protein
MKRTLDIEHPKECSATHAPVYFLFSRAGSHVKKMELDGSRLHSVRLG